MPLDRLISLPAKETDRIPIFSDGMWVGAWPHHTDPAPANIDPGDINTGIGRVCVNRHAKNKVNIVFVDGHAETVNLRELWGSRWNAQWMVPPAPPDP